MFGSSLSTLIVALMRACVNPGRMVLSSTAPVFLVFYSAGGSNLLVIWWLVIPAIWKAEMGKSKDQGLPGL